MLNFFNPDEINKLDIVEVYGFRVPKNKKDEFENGLEHLMDKYAPPVVAIEENNNSQEDIKAALNLVRAYFVNNWNELFSQIKEESKKREEGKKQSQPVKISQEDTLINELKTLQFVTKENSTGKSNSIFVERHIPSLSPVHPFLDNPYLFDPKYISYTKFDSKNPVTFPATVVYEIDELLFNIIQQSDKKFFKELRTGGAPWVAWNIESFHVQNASPMHKELAKLLADIYGEETYDHEKYKNDGSSKYDDTYDKEKKQRTKEIKFKVQVPRDKKIMDEFEKKLKDIVSKVDPTHIKGKEYDNTPPISKKKNLNRTELLKEQLKNRLPCDEKELNDYLNKFNKNSYHTMLGDTKVTYWGGQFFTTEGSPDLEIYKIHFIRTYLSKNTGVGKEELKKMLEREKKWLTKGIETQNSTRETKHHQIRVKYTNEYGITVEVVLDVCGNIAKFESLSPLLDTCDRRYLLITTKLSQMYEYVMRFPEEVYHLFAGPLGQVLDDFAKFEKVFITSSSFDLNPLQNFEEFFADTNNDDSIKPTVSLFGPQGVLMTNLAHDNLLGENTFGIPLSDNKDDENYYVRKFIGKDGLLQKLLEEFAKEVCNGKIPVPPKYFGKKEGKKENDNDKNNCGFVIYQYDEQGNNIPPQNSNVNKTTDTNKTIPLPLSGGFQNAFVKITDTFNQLYCTEKRFFEILFGKGDDADKVLSKIEKVNIEKDGSILLKVKDDEGNNISEIKNIIAKNILPPNTESDAIAPNYFIDTILISPSAAKGVFETAKNEQNEEEKQSMQKSSGLVPLNSSNSNQFFKSVKIKDEFNKLSDNLVTFLKTVELLGLNNYQQHIEEITFKKKGKIIVKLKNGYTVSEPSKLAEEVSKKTKKSSGDIYYSSTDNTITIQDKKSNLHGKILKNTSDKVNEFKEKIVNY